MVDTSAYEAWMPPDLDEDRWRPLLARYPYDPHRAAAMAWDEYAATLVSVDDTAEVGSVSTGAQSVSYVPGASLGQLAAQKAAWHWARVRRASILSPDYPEEQTATPRVLPPTWVWPD